MIDAHTRATDILINQEVYEERRRQDLTWGEQNHPNGTDSDFAAMREHMRQRCKDAANTSTVTWEHVASEEYFEALAETDDERLRAELIQLTAVLVAWVACIDRRRAQVAPAREEAGNAD